jgi:diaminopimelate epimerase
MGIFAGNHPQEGAARRKLQDLLEEMEGDSIVVATHPNLKGADMQMRVFEKRTPDGDDIGEESVFCGNGALLMAYLHARSAEAQKRRIVVSNKLGNVVELGAESTDGITAHLEVDSFDIDQDTSKQIFGMWDGVKEVHLKKAAGEPHVVVEIDPDVPQQRRGGYESLALRIKSAIQKSSFGERVNVNFVFKQGDVVKAFVHERGVEGFTGSCGTGSASISSALNMDTATISFAIPDVSGSWSDGGVIEVTERGGKYGLHSQMINVTSGDSKDVHLKTKPEH